jgi:hypothetical protein
VLTNLVKLGRLRTGQLEGWMCWAVLVKVRMWEWSIGLRDTNWRLNLNRFCIWMRSTGNKEAILGGYYRGMQILHSFTQVPMEGGNQSANKFCILSLGQFMSRGKL